MAQSNLEEKITLLTGKGMWHTHETASLPSIHLSDGPHGLRKQEEQERQNNVSQVSTCYPTASALACSWDPTAAARLGTSVAREAWNEDISVLLGPGINIKRSPLCGRNFEYFSEDPFLSGRMAAAYVKAVQSEGIAVSLKHFAGNNQETHRQTANSQIDERALREIYLSAFEYVVKTAKPATVMASYNRLNGYYACENRQLLTEILREEWGFKGAVISDWGACVDLAKSIKAGMDLEMPDSCGIHARKLKKAFAAGEISEDEITRAAKRVEALVTKYAPVRRTKKGTSDAHKVARQLAYESAVLLKNDGILPLRTNADVTVIGSLAEHMRFQGGGSSHIHTANVPSAIDALRDLGIAVSYAPGYSLQDLENQELEAQALRLVSSQKTVLFFGGLTDQYEGEGYDRKTLAMPANQLRLLNKICKVNPNVVFVSFSGAPYDMPFENQVRGILQMYLCGEAVGKACGDLLTGRANPSGKLAESWPYTVEDTPCHGFFATGSDDVEYRESIYVGYRYYDSFGIPVRFPFGYGLSYTTFRYTNLELNSETYTGGKLYVSLDVTNTGPTAGAEIVELYVENPPANYLRAKKELKGFQKITLAPGETRHISLELDERSFSIYDGTQFRMPSGHYRVLAGSFSQDIRLAQVLNVVGEPYTQDDRERLPEYFQKNLHSVSQAQFAELYGRPLSHFDERRQGDYGPYSSLRQLAEASPMAKLLRKAARPLVYSMFRGIAHDDPEVVMMLEGVENGTIDSVVCQSGGMLPPRLAEAMILEANGHRGKAFWKLIRG